MLIILKSVENSYNVTCCTFFQASFIGCGAIVRYPLQILIVTFKCNTSAGFLNMWCRCHTCCPLVEIIKNSKTSAESTFALCWLSSLKGQTLFRDLITFRSHKTKGCKVNADKALNKS